jgi:hypothetical protein
MDTVTGSSLQRSSGRCWLKRHFSLALRQNHHGALASPGQAAALDLGEIKIGIRGGQQVAEPLAKNQGIRVLCQIPKTCEPFTGLKHNEWLEVYPSHGAARAILDFDVLGSCVDRVSCAQLQEWRRVSGGTWNAFLPPWSDRLKSNSRFRAEPSSELLVDEYCAAVDEPYFPGSADQRDGQNAGLRLFSPSADGAERRRSGARVLNRAQRTLKCEHRADVHGVVCTFDSQYAC